MKVIQGQVASQNWILKNVSEVTSIKGANDKAKTLQRVKSTMKSIIFLFPLTGTCWLFGIMSLQKEMHIAYQYLFTITNSFQAYFRYTGQEDTPLNYGS